MLVKGCNCGVMEQEIMNILRGLMAQKSITNTEDEILAENWMIDPETGKSIPKPIREYAPVYYWKVKSAM